MHSRFFSVAHGASYFPVCDPRQRQCFCLSTWCMSVSDGGFQSVITTEETSELWLEFIPHFSHLSVSLDLGVNKSPQNVGCDWKVDEDELCLLMKAEQGEVVPELHRLNGVFLLNNS